MWGRSGRLGRLRSMTTKGCLSCTACRKVGGRRLSESCVRENCTHGLTRGRLGDHLKQVAYSASQEEICGNLSILVEPQTGTGAHRFLLTPSPRLSARPGAFLQPRFEYAPIRRPHREEVAMRVFPCQW